MMKKRKSGIRISGNPVIQKRQVLPRIAYFKPGPKPSMPHCIQRSWSF
jgi:hypothetical protein